MNAGTNCSTAGPGSPKKNAQSPKLGYNSDHVTKRLFVDSDGRAMVLLRKTFICLGLLNALAGFVAITGYLFREKIPVPLAEILKSLGTAVFLIFLLTWPLTVIMGIAYKRASASAIKSVRLDEMICLSCGYSLRDLPGNRCPECGRAFDPGNWRTFRPEGRRPNRMVENVLWVWICVAGIWWGLFFYGLLQFLLLLLLG